MSHFCSPWQFWKKQTLNLHQVSLCPSINGKAITELRPIRHQSCPILQKPAPSWRITLESRNIIARLAKCKREFRSKLWNFHLLSRSRGLLSAKLTHCFQIEASKHRPVGCLFLPEGGSLSLPMQTRLPSLAQKRILEIFSQGMFPWSWGWARGPTRTGEGKTT